MNKHKLSYRLAYWIVLTSTILTLVFSIFFLYHEYTVKLDEFRNEIHNVKKENNKALTLALWHYDVDSISAFLEDTVDNKRISYAEIRISNRYVKSEGIKKFTDVVEEKFEFTRIIDSHKYKVGELIVQGNIEVVREEIFDLAMPMIFAELLKVIFMTLFVVFLLKKLFMNNLEKLAEYTNHLNILNLDKELKLDINDDIKDELSVVVNSFNNMRVNLLLEIEKSNIIKKDLAAFRHAVEESYNSIVITDLNRNITYVNDVFEEVTGYKKSEVIGQNPNILKVNSVSKTFFDDMNKKLDNGLIWRGELTNVKKDGTVFYEKASIIPIFVDGVLVNYLAIKLDITDYKESEQKIKKLNSELELKVEDRTKELLEINDELNNSIVELKSMQIQLMEAEKTAKIARVAAEEANREKSMFLANVSHELKTPLNGILGLVYLSKLKVRSSEVMANLTNISEYSNALLRMISDLLDTSKMDAKQIDIINGTFSLTEMLKSINQLYTMQCCDKNIKFVLNFDKNIPHNLISDSVRLHQVITNLLNNAVKFTHDGSVVLNVNIEALNDTNVKLRFEIKDDGIGIVEEELKNIFKPFYQTKESLNYYAGGSGLGLNICKKIVEEMKGSIWAESEKNKGSSFFVLLDFEISNVQEIELKDNSLSKIDENSKKFLDNGNKKVLVVDDNHINREVLDGILKSIGINCYLANNGLEALEMVNRNKFDIVLTDIKMPVMDGCVLTKRIREKYDFDELPIIAISANTNDDGSLCPNNESFNDYIQKPINPEKFLQKLAEYIDCNIFANIYSDNIDLQTNNVLDIKDALVRFVNNNELYMDALNSFVFDYKNSTKIIKDMLNKQKTKEAIDYLHTIKGLSANLSAKEFSKSSSQLHDTIKYGKNYEHIIDIYNIKLEELISEINNYCEHFKNEEIEENSNNKENDEEVLEILFEYCKENSTKSIHYLKETLPKLKKNSFVFQLKDDIYSYKFNQAKEKIENYLKNDKKNV